MRVALLVVGLWCGCAFHPLNAATDAEPPSLGDDAQPLALCAPDPALLVCFSFDAESLASPVANEGSATVAAELTNVVRIPQGAGGAAVLDATSQMRVPPNAQTTGFASVEAWVRIDADPPVGDRVGILDADPTSSAVSLFYYYPSPGHQVRFELGQQVFLDFTLELGTWHYVAQVCDGATLAAFVDGVKIGEHAGCSPGDATTYGLQLGGNNTGTGGDQGLVGAIDGIRMWTTALSPTAICRTAGRADC